LTADPHQVDPVFAENFNAGRYKKFSSSFYAPDSPSNPVPGVWYLRHIGTLGAVPPAVKGLRQYSFSEAESGVVCFSDWTLNTQATLWRRMRDWFIAEKGQDVADLVIPDYAVNDLRDESLRQDPPAISADPINPSFSENSVTPEQIAALQAENARLAKLNLDAETEKKQRVAAERNAQSISFAEAQIAAGKLAPKHKDAVVAFLNFAETPNAEGGVVSFGEGDNVKPLGASFKEFLQEQPKIVSFSEFAGKGNANTDSINPLVADAEQRAQKTK